MSLKKTVLGMFQRGTNGKCNGIVRIFFSLEELGVVFYSLAVWARRVVFNFLPCEIELFREADTTISANLTKPIALVREQHATERTRPHWRSLTYQKVLVLASAIRTETRTKARSSLSGTSERPGGDNC